MARKVNKNYRNQILREVNFELVKIGKAKFQDSKLRDCSFHNCDLNGIHFEEANLRDVEFHYCNLSNAKFMGASVNIKLISCDCRFAIFDKALINRLVLEDCNLEMISLRKVYSNFIDIKNCLNIPYTLYSQAY